MNWNDFPPEIPDGWVAAVLILMAAVGVILILRVTT